HESGQTPFPVLHRATACQNVEAHLRVNLDDPVLKLRGEDVIDFGEFRNDVVDLLTDAAIGQLPRPGAGGSVVQAETQDPPARCGEHTARPSGPERLAGSDVAGAWIAGGEPDGDVDPDRHTRGPFDQLDQPGDNL